MVIEILAAQDGTQKRLYPYIPYYMKIMRHLRHASLNLSDTKLVRFLFARKTRAILHEISPKLQSEMDIYAIFYAISPKLQPEMDIYAGLCIKLRVMLHLFYATLIS